MCVHPLDGVHPVGVEALQLVRLPPGSVLCITGPIDDGFWTRALVVLYQAQWARRRGLPFVVFQNSSADSFNGGGNAWEQYFEPVSLGCLPGCVSSQSRHT